MVGGFFWSSKFKPRQKFENSDDPSSKQGGVGEVRELLARPPYTRPNAGPRRRASSCECWGAGGCQQATRSEDRVVCAAAAALMR
jgi:hypothetical protein